jgi:hypothetical protein
MGVRSQKGNLNTFTYGTNPLALKSSLMGFGLGRRITFDLSRRVRQGRGSARTGPLGRSPGASHFATLDFATALATGASPTRPPRCSTTPLSGAGVAFCLARLLAAPDSGQHEDDGDGTIGRYDAEDGDSKPFRPLGHAVGRSESELRSVAHLSAITRHLRQRYTSSTPLKWRGPFLTRDREGCGRGTPLRSRLIERALQRSSASPHSPSASTTSCERSRTGIPDRPHRGGRLNESDCDSENLPTWGAVLAPSDRGRQERQRSA